MTKPDCMDYETARQFIVSQLERDARLHEQGQFEKIGSGLKENDERFPRDYDQLMIAWDFWDSWIDDRNHGFPGFSEGVEKETWSKLARHIAEQLSRGQEITEPLVLKNFVFKRGPSLFSRLTRLFKRT